MTVATAAPIMAKRGISRKLRPILINDDKITMIGLINDLRLRLMQTLSTGLAASSTAAFASQGTTVAASQYSSGAKMRRISSTSTATGNASTAATKTT